VLSLRTIQAAAGHLSVSSRQRIRILVAVAILIVIGVIGLAGWMIVDSRRTAWNHSVQSEENLLIALENGINRNIELYDLSLRTVMNGLKLPEIWSLSDDLRRYVVFDGAVNAQHLGAMAATDEQGKILISSVIDPTGNVDYHDRDYFIAHRDHADLGLLVTGPIRSKLTGSWALAFSRRLNRPDGSFAGVVVGTMKLTLFQQLFDSIDLGGGRVGLMHAEGRLIIRQPFDAKDIGLDIRSGQLAEHVAHARSGHYQATSILDGVDNLYAFREIGNLPLFVFARMPIETIFAEWRQKTIATAIALFGLVGLAGILGAALAMELRGRSRAEAAAIEGERRLVVAMKQADRARLDAETASRVKSEFLANMSHELRTPLNAIIGFSEVLRDALIGPVDRRHREYAKDIHDSGRHLLRVINDVLDLSKVEVGRLELCEEPVNIEAVLYECRSLIAEPARKAEVQVIVDTPQDLPLVLGDALRLKQIVLNLVSNAVKFTRAGGRVVVVASTKPDGGIAIAVTDTGIGMNPNEIPKALEPFRQLDSSFARRFEGTGLGLPLAKRLTELHGGTLGIDSAVGFGTTVTLALPPERSVPRTRAA
jgi:two-component system, cell cycle sensor histidine kinase PleC